MNFQPRPVRKEIENEDLIKLLPRWQTNTSPNDLGVIRFGFDLFPETLKREYGVADWVRPALHEVLKYDPKMTKLDRQHAICTYRDGSKTTWFTKILPLYFMLVGQFGIYYKEILLPEVDYIRVRGKNLDEAEKKLGNVTMEFNNPTVRYLFGRLKPTLKEIKDEELKKTSKFIILTNGYIYQALGIDSPSRGALIKGRRPKLDIDDDVQGKDNVKTAHQRKLVATEVLAEQIGGLDKEGLTIYIGNFVHNDCFIKHLLENPSWKRQFYAITKVDKDGEILFDKNGERIPDWAKRFNNKYVDQLEAFYESHEELGGRAFFFREYYNKLISDQNYKLPESEGEYRRKNGVNWIVIREQEEGRPVETFINCKIIVSLDPAISEDKKSSDAAVTVTAFCSDGQRRIVDISMGKFDIVDRYDNEVKEYEIKLKRKLALTKEDLSFVVRKGSVEELVRKIVKYKADGFVIEKGGQQLAWYNDVVSLLKKLNISIPGLPYRPVDEKTYKLKTGLLNWFAAGRYEVLKTCTHRVVLQNQVKTFSDDNNKADILDALHNAEVLGEIPSSITFSSMGIMRAQDDDIESIDELLDNPDVEAWSVLL